MKTKTINQANQIELSMSEARWIHRAMSGNERAQRTVSKQAVGELVYKQDFTQFIEANRDRLALVGEIGVCR